MFLIAQPLLDLAEIDGPDGWWDATGPECTFLLLPGAAGLPKGWTRFVVPVQAPGDRQTVPVIRADCGKGYRPLQSVLARRGAGRWSLAVHVPADVRALSLCPSRGAGPLRLGRVEAVATTRLGLGVRTVLSLGRRWLAEPGLLREASRAMAAAWRTGRVAGVRALAGSAILRHDAGQPPRLGTGGAEAYQEWIRDHEAAAPARAFDRRFSILIAAAGGTTERVAATLASLAQQPNIAWECLVGLAPGGAAMPRDADRRVSYRILETAERGAALAALADAAGGDWLVVLEPGDRLAAGALAALGSAAGAGIVYGDEDRVGGDGRRTSPCLKPAWSPELLHAYNYFGRPVAVARTAVQAVGGFAAGTGAGAEWDLYLRMTAAGTVVSRVPHILCHRPSDGDHERPLPGRPEAEQHRRVLGAYWERLGVIASVTTQPDGTLRSGLGVADPPLVSIIITDAEDPGGLGRCLDGLEQATDYPRMQIIVVLAGAADPLSRPQRGVEIVWVTDHFSHAAACNAGARVALGDVLLFLSKDVEITTPAWLTELVGCVLRPGVGVAGPLLVYPDGRVHQAGVSIGTDGCVGLFQGATADDWGLFGGAGVPRAVLAVGGCCQLVRRAVFARVGGFDETYAGGGSDVAFCLAARAGGWRVAYTPFARLTVPERTRGGAAGPDEDRRRIGNDLLRFGYGQDPFFHPALDPACSIPRLRSGASGLGGGASLAGWRQAGVERTAALDLGCDADVAEAVGLSVEQFTWAPPRPDLIACQWSAARWCVDLLRRRPDVRQRFPDALSAGAAGGFARWLATSGGRDLGLAEAAIGHIQTALAGGLSARPRQWVLTEAGLRGETAAALLPPGRAALLRFLLRGRTPLRLEETWWLALECAEDPARELMVSYRFNPEWQALFPDGLTIFGRDRFANWFRAAYRCDGGWTQSGNWPIVLSPAQHIRLGWQGHVRWQRYHPEAFATPEAGRKLLAWLASPAAGLAEPALDWLAAHAAAALAELAGGGVNVLGHFCNPSGLRTSADAIVLGLQAAGCPVSLRDVPVDIDHDVAAHADFDGFEYYDTTLLHIQPEPFFFQAFERSGLHPRVPRTYRIGYWYWELESVPEGWSGAVAEVDELWAATRFVGDAMRSRFEVPVFNLMPGIALPEFLPRAASQFGIPPGQFSFLFVFSMMSVMQRKNPLGLIRAFRAAFAASDPVVLVLKTTYGTAHPDQIRELQAAAAEADGKVMIIDEVFSTEKTISLMQACDAYVSLHRSEGFGLTLAEAMLLGKPVIATGYSGNLDFMNGTNSLLVDYRLIKSDRLAHPYAVGSIWAEPSETHAAALMRQVWDDPVGAARLGAAARADLTQTLSPAAAGRRMMERLAAIAGSRRGDMAGAAGATLRADGQVWRMAAEPERWVAGE